MWLLAIRLNSNRSDNAHMVWNHLMCLLPGYARMLAINAHGCCREKIATSRRILSGAPRPRLRARLNPVRVYARLLEDTEMTVIERAMIQGVVFEVCDLKDGGPPLFRWHRNLDDDEESAMGFDSLSEAAHDALRSLALV